MMKNLIEQLRLAYIPGVNEYLREAADAIEKLVSERNVCGSGPGCLYRDALIDALTEQLHSAQNEQKSVPKKAKLMDAALSASAEGPISGTTNWAKHVRQKLLVEQPTVPSQQSENKI